MQIRFIRGTVWAGLDRVEGDTAEVNEAEARLLVEGYRVAAYVDATPRPTRGMTVNPDPEPVHRDETPKRRRRG